MRYMADELHDLPTLSVSQTDDLKVDDGGTRIWLCRCGVADGMPYENQVTIERLVDGLWTTASTYYGGEVSR
jgi:hypothetical protein